MYYPDEVIDEVRSRNDIVDVISSCVKLQRRGSQYFGLCPFHSEKTASFSVSPAKQMYYCFGCGAGGNVISFRMQYENETFQEAVKALAERAGIVLPEETDEAGGKQRRALKERMMEANKLAGTFYYYQLRSPAGEVALRYLQERKLSVETMRGFGLGYAGKKQGSLCSYLKSKGIEDEVLLKSGLAGYDEKNGIYDRFWNRVMFPIMDVNSRIIGFGGRVMGDGKPKYLNSPETEVFDKGRNLYGLHIARRSRQKFLILCEGYMDVISMHQAGFTNAVASLGTALTEGHASLLRRYTDEVVLCYDSDDAGVRAALRAIPILRAAGIRSKVLRMEPYKDPDECLQAEGPEAFKKRLENVQSSFFFELSVSERQYDLQDPEDKTHFLTDTARRIARFETEIERENYTQAVARTYQVSYEGMKKMVLRMLLQGETPQRSVVTERAAGSKKAGIEKSEGLLLTWMSEYPGFYRAAKPYLKPEDFSDPVAARCASLLFEQLERGDAAPAAILDHFESEEERKEAAALFHARLPQLSREELLRAMRDTLRKVIAVSMDAQNQRQMDGQIPEGDDLAALGAVLERKRILEEIGKLPIEIDS